MNTKRWLYVVILFIASPLFADPTTLPPPPNSPVKSGDPLHGLKTLISNIFIPPEERSIPLEIRRVRDSFNTFGSRGIVWAGRPLENATMASDHIDPKSDCRFETLEGDRAIEGWKEIEPSADKAQKARALINSGYFTQITERRPTTTDPKCNVKTFRLYTKTGYVITVLYNDTPPEADSDMSSDVFWP